MVGSFLGANTYAIANLRVQVNTNGGILRSCFSLVIVQLTFLDLKWISRHKLQFFSGIFMPLNGLLSSKVLPGGEGRLGQPRQPRRISLWLIGPCS